MIKVIAACGNGMGTSMIMKIKLEKIFKELGQDANVEALSMSQAKGFTNSADIILCSKHLASEFNKNQKAKIIGVTNLMDENEIKEALKKNFF